ncbi:Hypothetical predicted protein [Octopus vulgaris]|uniref:Uncharacterized protein n=1 Tax=Octopus vulgaris TaxID=6645 RepID=A0AA36HIC0_OCTVU|nr:Hypothetical predicted protein [Octopus vulgaris]
MNNEIFSNELINKLNYSGGRVGRRDKLGEIVGRSRLKVRCGNYFAECMPGIDEITMRRLPHRTAMVQLSIRTYDEAVDYNFKESRDFNSQLVRLDDNVSVLMFRDTVILISTTTDDILQHKQLPQQQAPPQDICRWTDERFVVEFGKQLMFFNGNFCRLKTIKTEKYYNRIYSNNDNQLVCSGHYVRDGTQNGRDKYYYYVEIVDIDSDTCKYRGGVCCGVVENEEVEVVGMLDVTVTSGGDSVVMKWEEEEDWRRSGSHYVISR